MRSFTGTAEVTKKKRTGKGKKARTTRTTTTEERADVVEFVELSADEERAQATYEAARGWYAGCLEPGSSCCPPMRSRGWATRPPC